MAKQCALTGTRPLTGNRVSHSNIKTKRRQLPNLQWKTVYVPELKRSIRLRISTRAIRTIDKIGLLPFMRKQGLSLKGSYS